MSRLLLPELISAIDEPTTLPLINLKKVQFYSLVASVISFGGLYLGAIAKIAGNQPLFKDATVAFGETLAGTVDTVLATTFGVPESPFLTVARPALRFLILQDQIFSMLLLPLDVMALFTYTSNIGPIPYEEVLSEIVPVTQLYTPGAIGRVAIVAPLLSTLRILWRVIKTRVRTDTFVFEETEDVFFDLFVAIKKLFYLGPLWLAFGFYDEIYLPYYPIVTESLSELVTFFKEQILGSINRFITDVLLAGTPLNEVVGLILNVVVNYGFRWFRKLFDAFRYGLTIANNMLFIFTGLDLSNLEFLFTGVIKPVMGNSFDAFNKVVETSYKPVFVSFANTLQNMIFTSTFLTRLFLVFTNVLALALLKGVYDLLQIGNCNFEEFMAISKFLAYISSNRLNAADVTTYFANSDHFSNIGKYITPIVPNISLLTPIYENLVLAYLSLTLTPYTDPSAGNKIKNPLHYLSLRNLPLLGNKKDTLIKNMGPMGLQSIDHSKKTGLFAGPAQFVVTAPASKDSTYTDAYASLLIPPTAKFEQNIAGGGMQFSQFVGSAIDHFNELPIFKPGHNPVDKTTRTVGTRQIVAEELVYAGANNGIELQRVVWDGTQRKPQLIGPETIPSTARLNCKTQNNKTADVSDDGVQFSFPKNQLVAGSEFTVIGRTQTHQPYLLTILPINGTYGQHEAYSKIFGSAIMPRHTLLSSKDTAYTTSAYISSKFIFSKTTSNEGRQYLTNYGSSTGVMGVSPLLTPILASKQELSETYIVLAAIINAVSVSENNFPSVAKTIEDLQKISEMVELIVKQIQHIDLADPLVRRALSDLQTLSSKPLFKNLKLDLFYKGYLAYTTEMHGTKTIHWPNLPVLFFITLSKISTLATDPVNQVKVIAFFTEHCFGTVPLSTQYEPMEIRRSLAGGFPASLVVNQLTDSEIPRSSTYGTRYFLVDPVTALVARARAGPKDYCPITVNSSLTPEQKIQLLLSLVRINSNMTNLLKARDELAKTQGRNCLARATLPRSAIFTSDGTAGGRTFNNFADIAALSLQTQLAPGQTSLWFSHEDGILCPDQPTNVSATTGLPTSGSTKFKSDPAIANPYVLDGRSVGIGASISHSGTHGTYNAIAHARLGQETLPGINQQVGGRPVDPSLLAISSYYPSLAVFSTVPELKDLFDEVCNQGIKVKQQITQHLLLNALLRYNPLGRIIYALTALIVSTDEANKVTLYWVSLLNSFFSNLIDVAFSDTLFSKQYASSRPHYSTMTHEKFATDSKTLRATKDIDITWFTTTLPLLSTQTPNTRNRYVQDTGGIGKFGTEYSNYNKLSAQTAWTKAEAMNTTLSSKTATPAVLKGFLLFSNPLIFTNMHVLYFVNKMILESSNDVVFVPVLKSQAFVDPQITVLANSLQPLVKDRQLNSQNEWVVSPRLVKPNLFANFKLLFTLYSTEAIYEINKIVIFNRVKTRALLYSVVFKFFGLLFRDGGFPNVAMCFKAYSWLCELSSPFLTFLVLVAVKVISPNLTWLDAYFSIGSTVVGLAVPALVAMILSLMLEGLITAYKSQAETAIKKIQDPSEPESLETLTIAKLGTYAQILEFYAALLSFDILGVITTVAFVVANTLGISTVPLTAAMGSKPGLLERVQHVLNVVTVGLAGSNFANLFKNAAYTGGLFATTYQLPIIISFALVNVIIAALIAKMVDSVKGGVVDTIYKGCCFVGTQIWRIFEGALLIPILKVTKIDLRRLPIYLRAYNPFALGIQFLIRRVQEFSESLLDLMVTIVDTINYALAPIFKIVSEMHAQFALSPFGRMYMRFMSTFIDTSFSKESLPTYRIRISLTRAFKQFAYLILLRPLFYILRIANTQFDKLVASAKTIEADSFRINSVNADSARNLVYSIDKDIVNTLAVETPNSYVLQDIEVFLSAVISDDGKMVDELAVTQLFSLFPECSVYILLKIIEKIDKKSSVDSKYIELTDTQKERGQSSGSMSSGDIRKAQKSLIRRVKLKEDLLTILYSPTILPMLINRQPLILPYLTVVIMTEIDKLPANKRYYMATNFFTKLDSIHQKFCNAFSGVVASRVLGSIKQRATVLLGLMLTIALEFNKKYEFKNSIPRVIGGTKYIITGIANIEKTYVFESVTEKFCLVLLPISMTGPKARITPYCKCSGAQLQFTVGRFPFSSGDFGYYRVCGATSGELLKTQLMLQVRKDKGRPIDASENLDGGPGNEDKLEPAEQKKLNGLYIKHFLEARIKISAAIIESILKFQVYRFDSLVSNLVQTAQLFSSHNYDYLQFASLFDGPKSEKLISNWFANTKTELQDMAKLILKISDTLSKPAETFEDYAKHVAIINSTAETLARKSFKLNEDLFYFVKSLKNNNFRMLWDISTKLHNFSALYSLFMLSTNRITTRDFLLLISRVFDSEYLIKVNDAFKMLFYIAKSFLNFKLSIVNKHFYNYLGRLADITLGETLDTEEIYFEGSNRYGNQLYEECSRIVTEVTYILPTQYMFEELFSS